MKNDSSGKVLVIFLVITAILLISLTAVSLFFFQKETERRKVAEVTLEEYQGKIDGQIEEIQEIKKQNFLLQEKNKEADERINDLSDELELEKGLREEMKLEKAALEKQLEGLKKEKENLAKSVEETKTLKANFTKDLLTSEQKIKDLEAQLKAEVERSQKLGELYKKKEEEAAKKAEEEARVQQEQAAAQQLAVVREQQASQPVVKEVELGEIVINPVAVPELLDESPMVFDVDLIGRILSVDIETGFVIVNLGKKDGLTVGNILSVYRNDNYVGDIKITRLQKEMSAADLIQPLSVRKVRKNDQVKTK